MPEPYFLFDLDSVIAKSEVLPFLARNIDLEETVQKIAEQARLGFLPFEESLQLQLELLRPPFGEYSTGYINPSAAAPTADTMDFFSLAPMPDCHRTAGCMAYTPAKANEYGRTMLFF